MPNVPARQRRGAPPWLWLLLALILGALTWALVVVANSHRRVVLDNEHAEWQMTTADHQLRRR